MTGPAMPQGRRKGAGDENFPVGSWLIERRLRPAVAAYYAAARAADDIADDPALSASEKLARLDLFEAALEGRLSHPDLATAVRARRALLEAGVAVERLTRLLRAFRHDAVVRRCRDWDDLLAYCSDSAQPVGRFLLDLHHEDPAGYPAADALCTALQVINHLQDCRADFRRLERVYLPATWLAETGASAEELAAPTASPGLRRVIDRCLAGVEALLAEARPLPLLLRSTRLALEAAVILRLAGRLAARLRRRDPLAGAVKLSKPEMILHASAAVLGCLARRAVAPPMAGAA